MKKISTLFDIVYTEHGRKGTITDSVKSENKWVVEEYPENVKATRKFDGSACSIIDGILYKRIDCKIDKKTGGYKKPVPDGAIPCQSPDKITGHHPHWIICDRSNPSDKYFFEGFDSLDIKEDGTYELCGPKVNGNNEKFLSHILVPHGRDIIDLNDLSFEGIRDYLSKKENDIEGIVFWHKDGRQCKIRKDDFGFLR